MQSMCQGSKLDQYDPRAGMFGSKPATVTSTITLANDARVAGSRKLGKQLIFTA